MKRSKIVGVRGEGPLDGSLESDGSWGSLGNGRRSETFAKASAVIRLMYLRAPPGLGTQECLLAFLGAGEMLPDRPPRRGVAFDSEIRPTSCRDKLYLDPVSSHLPSVPAVPTMSAYVLTQRLYAPTPNHALLCR
jgi:hypothetical protein